MMNAKILTLFAILGFIRVVLPKLLMQWLEPVTIDDMSSDPHEN